MKNAKKLLREGENIRHDFMDEYMGAWAEYLNRVRKSLKPCPFCGKAGTVEITDAHDLEECENFEDEECPAETGGSCGFHAVVCSVHKGGCGASSGYAPTEKEAVELWNRRPGEND